VWSRRTNARQSAGAQKSNAQLVADLGLAAKRDEKFAEFIAMQITFFDAMGDDKRSPTLMFHEGVRGGRLGRDHTLEDVPNHYVRDCLIDYINDELPADRRKAAHKAVFNDLTPAEVEEYSTMIRRQKDGAEAIAGGYYLPPERTEGDQKLVERLKRIAKTTPIRTPLEASNIWQQEIKFEAIDESIDLAPRPGCGTRNYSQLEPIVKSVIKPDSKPLEMERGLDQLMFRETEIDRDCDQLRAMIKIFTRGYAWTPDKFRLALGGITRPALTTFLEKKGPTNGEKARTFQKSWEFFKRREILGLPLTPAPSTYVLSDSGLSDNDVGGNDVSANALGDNALQELDFNRGTKRKSTGEDTRAAKKPVKSTGSRGKARKAKKTAV
jgi:hypothetical protein